MFLLPEDSTDSTTDSSPYQSPQSPGSPQPSNAAVDLRTASLRVQFQRESQRTIDAVVDPITHDMRRSALEMRTIRRRASHFELEDLVEASQAAADRRALELQNNDHAIDDQTNGAELLRAMETPELDRIPMIDAGRIPSMDIPPLDTGSPVPPRRHDHLHPWPTMHYFSTGTSTPVSDADSAVMPEFRNPFPPVAIPLPPARPQALSYAPRRTSSFNGSAAVEGFEMRGKHAEMVAGVGDARDDLYPNAVRKWHRDSLLLSHPRLDSAQANEDFEKISRQNRRSLRRSSSL